MSDPKPVLFLDLDGTIILGKEELGHFITGPQEVELFPGVLDLVKDYKAKGWRIVVVSNQGGIALGHIADSTVNRIMQETSRLCANLFDRMLWCEHHPDAKHTDPVQQKELSQCFCRKPSPGLIFNAIYSLGEQRLEEYFRPYNCLMVGDMDTDRDCAASINIPFMWAKDWRLKTGA